MEILKTYLAVNRVTLYSAVFQMIVQATSLGFRFRGLVPKSSVRLSFTKGDRVIATENRSRYCNIVCYVSKIAYKDSLRENIGFYVVPVSFCLKRRLAV